jgi:hypothetical protein
MSENCACVGEAVRARGVAYRIILDMARSGDLSVGRIRNALRVLEPTKAIPTKRGPTKREAVSQL